MGCRTKRQKARLIRVVAHGGGLEVDLEQRAPGRGAYLCGGDCARKAVKQGTLGRALKDRAEAGPDFVGSVAAAASRLAG